MNDTRRTVSTTPKVVFVVPVRHSSSVKNWPGLKPIIALTLNSIAAQNGGNWECRVVVNRGTDLPPLPAGCHRVEVDLPLPELPDPTNDLEAYYEGVRTDKGLRILAALENLPPDCYVMIVDYDDFISRDIATYVAGHAGANGWFVRDGYTYSGGPWLYKMGNLHKRCGTCYIVRRDLLGSFRYENGTLDMTAVKRRLGSHIFLANDLERSGRPLSPLPFRGTIYRIGHSQATSGSQTLFRQMTPLTDLINFPFRTLRRLAMCYRPVGRKHRLHFGLPE